MRAVGLIGLFTRRFTERLGIAIGGLCGANSDQIFLAATLGYNGGLVVPTGGTFEDCMIDSISSKRISLPNLDLGDETLSNENTSSHSDSDTSSEQDLRD